MFSLLAFRYLISTRGVRSDIVFFLFLFASAMLFTAFCDEALCCVVLCFCQRFPPGRVNVCTVAAVSSCKKSAIDFPGETGREYFFVEAGDAEVF